MKNLRWQKLLLIFIIFIAFLLRIVDLNNWPAFFIPDEAINGYEAYSILKTGKDHWGNPWPIFFEGFSKIYDNRPPLFIYSLVPFVAVFGLNELAVRLGAVVWGILTVLMAYYLAKELFKKEEVGLLAAFFLAISPWHIFLSRYAHEAIPAPFFSSLGIFLLLKGLKNKKFFIMSAIPLALALYSYSVTKVFIPLLLIIFLIIYRKEIIKLKEYIIFPSLIFLIITIPFLYFNLIKWNQIQARFNQISIFNYSYWPFLFILHLFSYLSPAFLFNNYLFFIIVLALLGIYFLWQKRKEREVQFLFLVIVISVVPATLTIPNPHVIRSVLLLPFFEIIAAYGCWGVFNCLKRTKIEKKKILFFSSIIFLVFLSLNLLFLLKNNYPYNFKEIYYEFGFRELIHYIKENQAQYDKVVFSTKTTPTYYIYLLFYLKYPPKQFQSLIKSKKEIYSPDGLRIIDSFDKYKFCNLADCYSPKENNLYVAKNDELGNLKAKKIFYNVDGSILKIITND